MPKLPGPKSPPGQNSIQLFQLVSKRFIFYSFITFVVQLISSRITLLIISITKVQLNSVITNFIEICLLQL
jgi:hypothetical protein